MNNLYFACTDCETYLDAGYRWAYTHLVQPGIVTMGAKVNVEHVLQATPYWQAPKDGVSDWLHKLYPSVREFLQAHQTHNLVFWDFNDLPDDTHLDWLQLGYCASPSARYFAEVLQLMMGNPDWVILVRITLGRTEPRPDVATRIQRRNPRSTPRGVFSVTCRTVTQKYEHEYKYI